MTWFTFCYFDKALAKTNMRKNGFIWFLRDRLYLTIVCELMTGAKTQTLEKSYFPACLFQLLLSHCFLIHLRPISQELAIPMFICSYIHYQLRKYPKDKSADQSDRGNSSTEAISSPVSTIVIS